MAENNISLQEDEMQELSVLVAEALIRGESREQVVADLANNGIDDQEAEALVNIVEHQLFQVQPNVSEADGGGGGLGWIVWIAIGIGAKVLSGILQ